MTRRFGVAALAMTIATSALAAQDDKPDKKKDPFKPFADLVEDAVVREGFFDTYEKPGHLYVAIPQDRLNKDFLLTSEIARGVGAGFLFGGLMINREVNVVSLEKHGDKVYLLERPIRFTAPRESSHERAVELSFGSSVVQSAKIESIREDSALVIDVHDWFVSDLSRVSVYVDTTVARAPGKATRANFDKNRSYLESVRAFPSNVNIRAKLTFHPTQSVSLRSVPDSRYIPVSIFYTIAALPEEPMTPRIADDRVGFFLVTRKDFSEDDKTFFLRYAKKWRLECAGPADGDGLCDPKQPIVYYIDRTVPEEYRQAMIDGIEAFNAAFEAAGFRNGIRAEMLPEDADAEDIRYATLRWSTSDQPSYGAIGPSVADPRTGEILDADILFEANMLLGWKRFWRANIDPVTALEEMFDATEEELAYLAAGGEMASMGADISAHGTLLRAALAARGEINPGDPVPDMYIYEAMKRVTMHEVGHTLGLRHNFRSSYDTPFDKLHDKAWAEENGLASSVMEYPGINVAPPGQTNGYYYTPSVGSYDRWAIAWGYTPDPGRAKQLARQAARPGHAYGTDEDVRGSGALDPSVALRDLSDDPMAWGKQRADLIRGIWNKLPEYVLEDNSEYSDVTGAFRTLLTQYSRAVATGVKYIGGQYQYRDHKGDPNERGPFVPVTKAKQQQALEFLAEYALSEDAFKIPQEVLQQFGAIRWRDWGTSRTIRGRIDYPLHEEVLRVQTTFLRQVTSAMVFARIRDAEMKFGATKVLTIPELLDGLTEAIWSEAWTAPGHNVPAIRRDLQRAYLDRLVEYVTDPPERTPADVRSVARVQLMDLSRRIARRLTPPQNFDAYTFAHLTEAKARIEKALEAGLNLEK